MLSRQDGWYLYVVILARWKYQNLMRFYAILSRNSGIMMRFSYAHVTHMSLLPNNSHNENVFFCLYPSLRGNSEWSEQRGFNRREQKCVYLFILKLQILKCYHGNSQVKEKGIEIDGFFSTFTFFERKFWHVIFFIRRASGSRGSKERFLQHKIRIMRNFYSLFFWHYADFDLTWRQNKWI